MRALVPLVLLVGLTTAPSQTVSPGQAAPGQNSPAQSAAGQSASPLSNIVDAKAKAILDEAIQALGGQAYLNAADMSQTGRTYTLFHGQANGSGVLFWRFVKFPDKERIEVTKQRDIAYVYRGDQGYEITYKGTAELDAKTLAEYLRRREHSLDWVLRKWIKEPGVALLYEGAAIAADKPAEKVSVINSQNDSVTIFIDSTTHLPVKKTYTWRDPADQLRNTEDEIYDAYRETQGVMTPYSITRFYNGEMSNQRFLNSVTYNQNVSDTLFDARTTYDPARLPTKKK